MADEKCAHLWEMIEESCSCPTYDSRGSGQHGDPCYGATCPCEGHKLTRTYRCRSCGEVSAEESVG